MGAGRGIFFGVSVGPGDPELLTRKACRVLEACPVIGAAQTARGEQLALSIARRAVDLTGKKSCLCRFPWRGICLCVRRLGVGQRRWSGRFLTEVRMWPWWCWGMCRSTPHIAI